MCKQKCKQIFIMIKHENIIGKKEKVMEQDCASN
jgi:hypothetical protein